MKCIIAGSREITDYNMVCKAIANSKFKITEVVCGMAGGVDSLGKRWAEENNIPIKPFPADWNNINGPNVRIKYNVQGNPYNVLAGFIRNEQMAKYADAAIILIKNDSSGSKHMLDIANFYKLKVYKEVYD